MISSTMSTSEVPTKTIARKPPTMPSPPAMRPARRRTPSGSGGMTAARGYVACCGALDRGCGGGCGGSLRTGCPSTSPRSGAARAESPPSQRRATNAASRHRQTSTAQPWLRSRQTDQRPLKFALACLRRRSSSAGGTATSSCRKIPLTTSHPPNRRRADSGISRIGYRRVASGPHGANGHDAINVEQEPDRLAIAAMLACAVACRAVARPHRSP